MIETHNWQEAQHVQVGMRSTKPKFTIRNNGGIHLNSAFVRKYDIHKKSYVKALLFKSKDKSTIGFIFVDKEEPGKTLKLAFGDNKINASFSGRSILFEAGLNPERMDVMILEPQVEDYNGEKIFVIELKKEGDKIKNS